MPEQPDERPFLRNDVSYELAIELGRYDFATLFAVRELKRLRRERSESHRALWEARLGGAFTRRGRHRVGREVAGGAPGAE